MKNSLNLYGFRSVHLTNRTRKEVLEDDFTFVTLQNVVKKCYKSVFIENDLLFNYYLVDEYQRPYALVDYVKETKQLIVTLF